jgi:hypothetical protein
MSDLRLLPDLDDPVFEFPKKISGSRELMLLERGTCTYRAGQRLIGAAFEEEPNIMESRSFDEAIVRTAYPNGILLLPALANKPIVQVTFSYEWRGLSDYWFVFSNPRLYLAQQNPDEINEPVAGDTCAALPTLRGLLGNTDVSWVDVDNTQRAAEACRHGKANFCITNEEGLLANELSVVGELKKMAPSWHVYERTS